MSHAVEPGALGFVSLGLAHPWGLVNDAHTAAGSEGGTSFTTPETPQCIRDALGSPVFNILPAAGKEIPPKGLNPSGPAPPPLCPVCTLPRTPPARPAPHAAPHARLCPRYSCCRPIHASRNSSYPSKVPSLTGRLSLLKDDSFSSQIVAFLTCRLQQLNARENLPPWCAAREAQRCHCSTQKCGYSRRIPLGPIIRSGGQCTEVSPAMGLPQGLGHCAFWGGSSTGLRVPFLR